MSRLYTKYPYVWWAAAGLIGGVAFMVPWLWSLGILMVGLTLYSHQQAETAKEAFLGSWITGTIKSAGAIFWFWSTYPLSWIGIESAFVQLVLIGVYWFSCAIVLGAGFAFVLFLLKKLPCAYLLSTGFFRWYGWGQNT